MDREATLEREDMAANLPQPGDHGLRGLTQDLIGLAELHVKLMRVDARDATAKLITPAVLSAVALGFVLSVPPVALFAAGYAVAELAQWPVWAGLLSAALGGLVVASICAAAAYFLWRKTEPFFRRSAVEFRQNLARVQSMLSRRM